MCCVKEVRDLFIMNRETERYRQNLYMSVGKIETRLIDDMFASVMGEYVFLK